MIHLKSEQEISRIREGGAILSGILAELVVLAGPGVTTGEIEDRAVRLMRAAGGEPAFKGYRGGGDARPFPTAVCASLNSEVVHGPALPARVVKSGDLLKLDIGLLYRGCYTDMAVTVGIGQVSAEARKLARVTKEALLLGVAKVQAGGWISDIGKAVDRHARRNGFSTVKDLVGHGVGKHVHEDPQIPNFFDPTQAPVRIEPGMVLAIEPMINAGGDQVRVLPDAWTVATADGSLSAHFEMTVAVTKDGPEIMTPLPDTGF